MPISPMALTTQLRSAVAAASFDAEAALWAAEAVEVAESEGSGEGVDAGFDEMVESEQLGSALEVVDNSLRTGEVASRLAWIPEVSVDSDERVDVRFDEVVESEQLGSALEVVDNSLRTGEVASRLASTPEMSVDSEAVSLGRDSASATMLALPCTYLMSVVYSAIHES